MTLLSRPLLHSSLYMTSREKNVCFSSSRFLHGRAVSRISPSLWRRSSYRHNCGTSSLSISSQAGNAGEEKVKLWESTKRALENELEDWAKRQTEFQSTVQVSGEESHREQRMQVVDRATAALAAVNALLAESPNSVPQQKKDRSPTSNNISTTSPAARRNSAAGSQVDPNLSVAEVRPQKWSGAKTLNPKPVVAENGSRDTPGPDFWSWAPPDDNDGGLQPLKSAVVEKQPMKEAADLPINLQSRAMPSLPPLQSLFEVDKQKTLETKPTMEVQLRIPDTDTETAFAVNRELHSIESVSSGVNEDGSRWWKETGVEHRDRRGVVCKWTVIRGVSADEGTEWQEKFWEAFDAFNYKELSLNNLRDYKELGAEKCGRDSIGRVWNEVWKEAMWQNSENGLQHIEKTAYKWGKDGAGGEWREKWSEHYDAFGRTEKWAEKWSQVDSNEPLEPGHAHRWCERWGEGFNGQGGAMKYTDKWAERKEFGDTWTKWGDKWDEQFDNQGHGVKQGETWWESPNGEKWNRTWGDGHNGTGWVHKYGKSSSGEHWDTHTQEATLYERKPHWGFRECFDESDQLRQVNQQKKRQF